MCVVSSMPERLVPSCLNTFGKLEEEGKVVRWTQKTTGGGQSMPALAAAMLSGCLSSVWCGHSFTRCKDDFRLLKIAIATLLRYALKFPWPERSCVTW